jgi:glycosyltransferase involved in cell wall biosynthesis
MEELAALHPEAAFRWCIRPHRLARSWRVALPPGRRTVLLDRGPRGVDLFHGLNQRLPRAGRVPLVVTFHDLFVLTGEYSTREFRLRFANQAREAARRADRVMAVSRFTAAQVRDLLGVPEERIEVVPHGTDAPGELPAAAREKLILHTGALQKRKNLTRLVRAFRAAPEGWKLVLAGGSGYGHEEVRAAIEASPRRADIATPGYLPRAELEDLYRRAAIFAFASLDEGFGIPVLEAMAWGIPVITSNRSALPEAAGGAALLVNPEEEDEIADALRRLCVNGAERGALARAGRERVRAATWRVAAELTWGVYARLAGKAG